MKPLRTITTSCLLLLYLCLSFQTKAQDSSEAESYSLDGLRIVEVSPEVGHTIDREEVRKYNIERSKYGISRSKKLSSGKAFVSAQILQKTDTTYISRVLLKDGTSTDYVLTEKQLNRFIDHYFPSETTQKKHRKIKRIIVGVVAAGVVTGLIINASTSDEILF